MQQPPFPSFLPFNRSRRGFTLMELMMAVAIIAVLVAMLAAMLAMLRKAQRRASTLDLMTHITSALKDYLTDFPQLGTGSDSADFKAAPYKFLYRVPKANGGKQYIEAPVAQLSQGLPPGPYTETTPILAEHLLDFFPASDHSNRIEFEIKNDQVPKDPVQNRYYTYDVRIISRAGTPNDPSDDLIYHWTTETKQWVVEKPPAK